MMSTRPTILVFILVFATLTAAQRRRPNVNVQRQDAPTPEVHNAMPEMLQPGQTATIVLHGKFFTADAHDANASGECKLNAFKYVSPTEVQFTVTANKIDDGGSCELQATMGHRSVNNSVEVAMTALGRQHKAERERAEREQRDRKDAEDQKKMAEYQS